MPAFLKYILTKFMQSIVEILFIFPILLFAAVNLFPDSLIMPVISSQAAFYLTGILLGYFLKNKSNSFYVIISFFTGLIASFIIGYFISLPIFYTLMVSFSIFRGIRINNNNWLRQSPVPAFSVLFSAYLVFYVMFLMSPNLYNHIDILNRAGLVMIVVFLSICSFDQLKAAFFKKGSRHYIPSTILKFNITSLVIALILIIGLARFKPFWNSILALIKSVFLGLYTLFEKLLVSANDKVESKSKEVDIFGKKIYNNITFMETIESILTVVITIGFLVFTVYVFFKLAMKIANWLSNKFRGNITEENTLGYVDEREIVRKSPSKYLSNVKNIFHLFDKKELAWRDLTNDRDKVRFIFKQKVLSFIKKGYRFNDSLTPNELGKELEVLYKEDMSSLTSAYNKARYSNESIKTSEVEMLVKKHVNK
ncbi:MAG TPA: hypothetical protein VIO64_08525 [Pseudobacteroides sp.]|uniref:hypothetical protein n=1 Tax=Pseudobacteroides sp. TaxID=1968840 RepID=UPI002F95561E